MKKLTFLVVIIALLFCISCKNTEEPEKKSIAENAIILENLEYSVPITKINLEDNYSGDWFYNNIPISKRRGFVYRILKEIKEGKIDIFDNEGNKIDTTDYKTINYSIDTVYYQWYNPNDLNDVRDTFVIQKNYLEIDNIKYLKFIEDWYCDTIENTIKKDVKQIAFCAAPPKTAEKNSKPVVLFWIKLNKQESLSDNPFILTQFIYTILDIDKAVSNEQLASVTDKWYVFYKSIYTKAIKNEIEVYQFNLFDPSLKNSIENEKLEAEFIDSIKTTIDSTDNITKTIVINNIEIPENLLAVSLMENWQFDFDNMVFIKNTYGIEYARFRNLDDGRCIFPMFKIFNDYENIPDDVKSISFKWLGAEQ
ncbi:MAG: hypothetical protein K9J13_17240 [Saprospiraceae bacterium]|nr:hypothetical protein [Saprospiraceae bacterium]